MLQQTTPIRILLLICLPVVVGLSLSGFFYNCAAADAGPAPYDCGFPLPRVEIYPYGLSLPATKPLIAGLVVDVVFWSAPIVLWALAFRKSSISKPSIDI